MPSGRRAIPISLSRFEKACRSSASAKGLISGTDSTIQLSFFIVACDYTLIGEELFAASGYLSGDESILASVRSQDIIKVLIAFLLITATLWATLDPDSSWWRF